MNFEGISLFALAGASGGGGSGTVASITAGAGLEATPNPITTSGTIKLTDDNQQKITSSDQKLQHVAASSFPDITAITSGSLLITSTAKLQIEKVGQFLDAELPINIRDNIVAGVNVGSQLFPAASTGNLNVLYGENCLNSLAGGEGNVGIGHTVGMAVPGAVAMNSGSNNVMIGHESSAITDCSNAVAVGAFTRVTTNCTSIGTLAECISVNSICLGNSTNNAFNSIVIGNQIVSDAQLDSNHIIIGSSLQTCLKTQADNTMDIGESNRRFKDLYLADQITCARLNNTYFIRSSEDMVPFVSGELYVLPSSVRIVVVGNVTLEAPIILISNNSITGENLNARLTFDEGMRDCYISASSCDVLIENLTIVRGGGRFSLSSIGLFRFEDFNIGGGAAPPVFGRFNRVYLNNVILRRTYALGYMRGFQSIQINNCHSNGGGYLDFPTLIDFTNFGLSISGFMTCEINNFKCEAWRGQRDATWSESMIKFDAIPGVDPNFIVGSLEINNSILQPRGEEKGLEFTTQFRSKSGNVSSNVFEADSSSTIIEYGATPASQFNYNRPNVINIIFASNAGIADSKVGLMFQISNSIFSIENSEYLPILLDGNVFAEPLKISNRIGIKATLFGISGQWTTGSVIQPITGATATILYVDGDDIWLSDQNGIQFQQNVPVFLNSIGGPSAADLFLRFEFGYFEREPRRVRFTAIVTYELGENDIFFLTSSISTDGVSFTDDTAGQSQNYSQKNRKFQIVYESYQTFQYGDQLRFMLKTNGGDTAIIDGVKVIVN